MLDAGINLALGTDNVTNNNSYDMFKEMQIVGKLMALHHRTPNALPTRTILHMATLGGAQALGLADQIGSLEPGKDADIAIFPYQRYEDMAYRLGRGRARLVMKAGKVVFRDAGASK